MTTRLAAGLQRLAGQLGQAADRRGAEDELGALAGLGDAVGAAVDRADPARRCEGRRVGVIAADLGLQAPPSRQPDRAADQADAEDGDLHLPRRALTAAASRSSVETVVSQSMQASVIDWP